ncbi:cell division protein SepF, partial [Rhodococcus sp. 14C212]|nr:cell division protein SepF [Rhodococcus sp. 14C212]
MSSLHKFKAYFGMVPLEEYEDDYLDDPASARRERDREYDEPPYAGGGYGPSHRDEYKAARREDAGRDFEPDGFDRYEPPVRSARVEPITARAPRPT